MIEHKQSLEFEIKQSNVMTNANKGDTNRWTFEQWKMWDHTCWTKKIIFNIKKINLTRFSTIRISASFGQPNSANFTLVIFMTTRFTKTKTCFLLLVFTNNKFLTEEACSYICNIQKKFPFTEVL